METFIWKRLFAKVGRNSPCPCGSGKKYKVCSCYQNLLYSDYYEPYKDLVLRNNKIYKRPPKEEETNG